MSCLLWLRHEAVLLRKPVSIICHQCLHWWLWWARWIQKVIIIIITIIMITRKPLLELAPTTLVQRTRQTTGNMSRRTVHPRPTKEHFHPELWPMFLTFELDWDSAKMNQPARYPGQRYSSSKVIVRTHRLTQTPDRLLYLDHWNGQVRLRIYTSQMPASRILRATDEALSRSRVLAVKRDIDDITGPPIIFVLDCK